MRPARGRSGGLVFALTLAFATTVAAQPPQPPTAATPGQLGGAAPQPRPGMGQPPQPARDPARKPPAESTTGTAVIRGRAVTLDTGQPLRRVQIMLNGDAQRRPRSAMTGDDGRYEFKDLPPGRYLLSAQKSGYVGLMYGQRGPRETGRPLELADGQRLEKIDFLMPRGSVIAGRIVDEAGEPLADVSVMALAPMWIGRGKRRLMPSGRIGTTNDIGQYRLHGLPPGDYVVSATYQDGVWEMMIDEPGEAMSSGYAATFYPGTANVADAQRVTVGIGQEVIADMQLMPTRVARISGSVVDASGQPIDRGIVQLRARGDMFLPGGMRAGVVMKGGDFTITGVTPGNYIMLLEGDRRSASDAREAAFAFVTVGGEDVTGVRLAMSRGGTLRGRVLFEGGRPADAATVQVMCGGMDPESSLPMPDPVKSGEDGTFELQGVFGPCHIDAMIYTSSDRLPSDWTTKSVYQGGADVTDRSIEVSDKSIGDVEILVTNKIATLTGTVTGSNAAPVLDYTPIAFTEDKSLWGTMTRRVRPVRPDQKGVFKVQTLPPGDYLVAAVERLDSGVEWDPETLARLAPLATRVTLGEGATRTVTVKLSAFP